jgi:hypothetical protein
MMRFLESMDLTWSLFCSDVFTVTTDHAFYEEDIEGVHFKGFDDEENKNFLNDILGKLN